MDRRRWSPIADPNLAAVYSISANFWPGEAQRYLMGAAARRRFELPEPLIEVEGCGFLPRRIFDKVLDLLRDKGLHSIEDIGVRYQPIPIGIRILVSPLEWIAAQVKHFRGPQFYKWFK